MNRIGIMAGNFALLASCFALWVICASAPVLAQSADVTLQTIRSEYAATLAPMTTVWTKSALHRSLTEASMKQNELSGSPVEWVIDGPKWLLTFDFDGPDANVMQGWYSYDGNR